MAESETLRLRDSETLGHWGRESEPTSQLLWHQLLHHVALQRFETLPSNCNNFSPVASVAASAWASACTWLLLHQHKKHKFWPANRDAPHSCNNNYSNCNCALQHTCHLLHSPCLSILNLPQSPQANSSYHLQGSICCVSWLMQPNILHFR